MKSIFSSKQTNFVDERKSLIKFYPLIAMILTAFTYFLSLIFLKVIGYGNNTILQSDLIAQYISFLQMFKRLLQGQASFWYTFSEYLGSGSVLTYAYYTLNPFNLLLLIPGANAATIVMIIIIVKISLIGYTMEYFLQKGLKLISPYTILFSMCFALNGFVATLAYHLMWLDAIYMTPMLTYLVMRFVRTRKWFPLVPAYAYLFITNFYMGFMVGIFTGIVFILYSLYCSDNSLTFKKRVSYFIKQFLVFIFSVLLGAGICAVILYPTAHFLFSHAAEDNYSFEELSSFLPEIINAMFVGQSSSLDNTLPFLYAGLPVLIIVPFYFMNKNRTIKEKIYICVLLVFYLFSMIYLPLYKLMHAFDYPNFYAYRFSYVIIFILVAIAAKEYEENVSFRKNKLLAIVLFLIFLYSALIPIKELIRYELPVNTNSLLCLNALLLLLWGLLISHKNIKQRRLHSILCFLLIIIELCVNTYLCEFKGANLVNEEIYNEWCEKDGAIISSIAPKENEFYRIRIDDDPFYNSACQFGIASFNTFSSSDDYNLRMLLNKLGYTVSNRVTESSGATPVTDMLFATKYCVDLTNVSDTEMADISNLITENPYTLSIGYMVSPLVKNYASTSNPFVNQENLLYAFTGQHYALYESIDSLNTYAKNISLIELDNGFVFHRITDVIAEGSYYYIAPHYDNKIFMAVFPTEHPRFLESSPGVLGKRQGISRPLYMAHGSIVSAISNAENTEDYIGVLFADDTTDYYIENAYFAYYNKNNIIKAYEELEKNQLILSSFSDNYIEGTVISTDEKPLLFLSIPYDESWTVTVDGIPSTVYKVLEDAFCCIVLPEAGEHHIVLEYKAEGADLGRLISIVSLSLYLLFILYTTVKRNNRKRHK